jgi:NAD-specific glutamate dehydrogenase
MALKKSELRAIFKNEDSTIEEKISEVLNILHEEVDAIKDERDEISQKLKDTEAELKTAKDNAGAGSEEWEKKYNDEHAAFEAYKTEQADKEVRGAKEAALKGLMKEVGIGEKIAELLIPKIDLEAIEIEDGKIKDADKLSETYKEEYKDYIQVTSTQGASTQTPPPAGGSTVDLDNCSMEDYIKARKN